MRPLATDTHDFPSIRRDGCIYVDKTKFIHSLITTVGTKLFFVSRPRRFGKSLTVSALKALFQGQRELFKGLAIDCRLILYQLSYEGSPLMSLIQGIKPRTLSPSPEAVWKSRDFRSAFCLFFPLFHSAPFPPGAVPA